MIMNRHRLLVPAALFVMIVAGQATADDEKPLKGDLAKFQGTWTTKLGPEHNLDATITIKGTDVAVKVTTPDGQDFEIAGVIKQDFEIAGVIKVDEDAKPQKTIDWVKFKTPNGDDAPDNLGIYEFVDKDTLKVCNGGHNNPRPKELKAGDGGDPELLTLKRKADKPEADKPGDTKPVEIKGDLAKLQGSWTGDVGPEKNVPVTLLFKESTVSLIITFNGEDRTFKGEIKLDEAAKPQKTIDWINFKGVNGEDTPPNLGIYKIDADKFTVCSGGPGNPRPTEYKGSDDGPPNLTTFTKKPAAK